MVTRVTLSKKVRLGTYNFIHEAQSAARFSVTWVKEGGIWRTNTLSDESTLEIHIEDL